ncbi:methyl-accepting chemotaxis protein [Bdellovibrio sp. ArHS]|uniref:methyl-accepting chemotaxis protein n=1 Tax=Bdellovibrio sp. ArHS TaxID=1569284 RepID=UPI0025C1E461|nr:methyl-accepting chemotaxis protein [Bdellovibrio sp. ArHS]
MRLSLRVKITGLVFMSLVLALMYGGIHLHGNIKRSQEAKDIVARAAFFNITSRLIHEMQVERGKTAMFMGHNLSDKELQDQRSLVDKNYVSFVEAQEKQNLNIADLKALKELYSSARQMTDEKGPVAKVIAKYTEAVSLLIDSEVKISKLSVLEGLEMHMLGVNMLELSKEYSGRLRANVANILGAKAPLSMTQIALLQDLQSRIYANLRSPLIELSSEGKLQVEDLLNGDQWKKVLATYENVFAEAQTGHFATDSKHFYQDISSSINDLHEIVLHELKSVENEAETIYTDARKAMWFTVTVLCFAVVFLVITSIILINSLTKPLHKAIISLNEASDSVSLSGGQVTQASHQVSSNAVESASALEEIVASVEELNSIVNQNATRAGEAAKLSANGTAVAENGQKEITTLITAMNEIASSSRRIEEIITVIDDIAFQTNLLALNAAVEAARAGEQGKGFAVVAEAVRSLAQRSAVAAKDISSLIKESVNQVENGSRVAGSSEVVLSSIVQEIKKIAVLNNEIAEASNEQALGIQQINKAMAELDTSTQANASVAEEVSASADQMNGQVGNIGQLVHILQEIVDGAA